MKLLTGFALIHDTAANKIAYSFNEVDDAGNVTKQNVKESFLVIDPELKELIERVEEKIKPRLESTTK